MRPLFIVFLFALLGASHLSWSQDKGVVKSSYHNVTAHYNSYWIANERIKEVESSILQRHSWDYNRMLPVFAQFDTTTSKSLEDPLLDCIEKASISIQRHPGSKWEDEAYILVGLARLYGSEFPEAIETFKYVNTHSSIPASQHKALVHLMRTFIEANELENALAVADYMRKEELDEPAMRDLAVAKGYYYQKMNMIPEMATSLQVAVSLMQKDNTYARTCFTLGQALQVTSQDSLASIYYREAVKHADNYELSFYARLNQSQVSQANSNASDREIRKYFKRLLKDPKNEEYKGRIHFELGDFNYKKGLLSQAIKDYETSIQENQKDTRLKGYTYQKLASIYYDDLKDYRLASAYYDSTATNYPKEEEGYEDLVNRAEILKEFVGYYETIKTNDSLLILSEIPSDSLEMLLNFMVDKKETELKENAEKEKKEKRRSAIIATSNASNEFGAPSINTEMDGTWYFYNTTELSKGFSSFKNIWGQRPLEDNWRRSLKTGGSDQLVSAEQQETSTSEEAPEGEDEAATFNREEEIATLRETIPVSLNDKKILLQQVEEASYQLGKIYNFKLEEKENAIETFEGFVQRFDTSRYIPEVLYQLFLLYKPVDTASSDYYFDLLTTKHDTSIYAKLALNPNYLDEKDRENEDYKEIFVRAYALYESGQSKASQQLIDSALFYKPQNEYVDNLELLKAMNQGQLEGIYKYQFELSNFIKEHNESDLVAYAESLLQTSQDFQINLYSSSKAKYIKNFDTKHYFILIYPFRDELTDAIPEEMKSLVNDLALELTTGNIVLDGDNAIVLVNEFPDLSSATSFLDLYLNKEQISTKFATDRLTPMVITDENFQIFYETKDLESYLTFFNKNYSTK